MNKMHVKILVDTTADLSLEEMEKFGVECVPLKVNFGDESFKDTFEISPAEFYEKMNTAKELPKTSQPSPADFLPHFLKAKEEGYELIAIVISSKLSGTYQSAVIAREEAEYDKIYIVDSESAAVGIRLLLEAGVRKLSEGVGGADTASYLNELKTRIRLTAGVETLENLIKGGRLSKTSAVFANVLNIKPVLELKDGAISAVAKPRGVARAARQITERVKTANLDTDHQIAVLYSDNDKNALELIDKLTEAGIDIDKSRLYGLGPTLGTHVGIGAFGVAFVEKE